MPLSRLLVALTEHRDFANGFGPTGIALRYKGNS